VPAHFVVAGKLQRLRFGHGGIVNAARRDCTRECALVFQSS
jgi:hypothetical protein